MQDMRTWKQAEEAGKAVGFNLLESRDVAQASAAAVQPWYMRLGGNVPLFRWIGAFNGSIVAVMEFLRIAPRGLSDVHKMLFDTGGGWLLAGWLLHWRGGLGRRAAAWLKLDLWKGGDGARRLAAWMLACAASLRCKAFLNPHLGAMFACPGARLFFYPGC
jgi:hypothetical protein